MRKKVSNRAVSLMLTLAMLFSMVVVATPQDVSAADPEFKSAGKSSVSITDEQSYNCYVNYADIWIKYQAKNDGYLKVSAKMQTQLATSYVEGKWALYDKGKKKQLSPLKTYNTKYTGAYYNTEYFGVKKGTTYYLRVDAYGGGVRLDAAFTKVKDKSGTKKAKALNVKKGGKGVTGIIQAGKSGAHYFKIKMPSYKNVKIKFTSYLTDSVYVTITGTRLARKNYLVRNSDSQYIYWGITQTFPGKIGPGTYYIQVKPATKTATGYYKLSWK